jgi:hypothetical protein
MKKGRFFLFAPVGEAAVVNRFTSSFDFDFKQCLEVG